MSHSLARKFFPKRALKGLGRGSKPLIGCACDGAGVPDSAFQECKNVMSNRDVKLTPEYFIVPDCVGCMHGLHAWSTIRISFCITWNGKKVPQDYLLRCFTNNHIALSVENGSRGEGGGGTRTPIELDPSKCDLGLATRSICSCNGVYDLSMDLVPNPMDQVHHTLPYFFRSPFPLFSWPPTTAQSF